MTREKNNLLEDEIKTQIRIPIWPSQIPDLAKFLFGLRQIHMIKQALGLNVQILIDNVQILIYRYETYKS